MQGLRTVNLRQMRDDEYSGPGMTSIQNRSVYWSPSDIIADSLYALRKKSISAIVDELNEVHPPKLDLVGGSLGMHRDTLNVTAIDVPTVADGWRRDSETAMLFTTQRHHFAAS